MKLMTISFVKVNLSEQSVDRNDVRRKIERGGEMSDVCE